MKKTLLLAMLSLTLVLMTATMASAAAITQPYYHGDFATDSTGCAQCHVTHAASAARLLFTGTTQTGFCNYCHSDLTKAPYNTVEGKIDDGAGTMPSVAGGFVSTYKFDTAAYNNTDGAVVGNYTSSSSMHGVETYDNDDWKNGVQIPGGSTNLSGDFRCGSCHNPHAGGSGAPAPRLLKLVLPKTTFTSADFSDWTFTAATGSLTGAKGYATKVITGYGDKAGEWCAGCHDAFNQTAHLAGQNTHSIAGPNAGVTDDITNKYMHRMNFVLSADGQTYLGTVYNQVYNEPLSVGKKLTCLTCHRAHATAATVTNDPSWQRAASYEDSGVGGLTTFSSSSALLRLKNRDVCYNCHGAAVGNTVAIQGS